MKPQQNLILDLTFKFALEIINYSEKLEMQRKYVLAKQVLRSGTSVGANVRESQHAESKKDFIHKMKIAAKEAEEIKYWLELCDATPNYPSPVNLFTGLESIQKVLTKIIVSSKTSTIN